MKYEVHKLNNRKLPFIFRDDEMIAGEKDYTHWHENIELLYFYEGEGLVTTDFKSIRTNTGDVFVINSEKMHMVESAHEEFPVRYYCLIIDSDFCVENGIPVTELYFRDRIEGDEELQTLFLKVAAAYGAMTSSPTALLLFGSLPCSYYIFDYATTIYSDALYSGIQALNEFLPTVLVVFYVLFLPAFHVQSQKRSSAEMQRSLLEVELKQSQQEMDSLRQSEMQTAVYQHDMRHHLNMISGLLASGSPQQAQEYIQKVQSDVEAITSRRFCENETVNLLCSSFVQKAEKSGVTLNVDARVPAHLPISDTELCSLLSNALENALRAASTLRPEFRRTVDLYCGIRLNKLLIEVRNPYDTPPVMRDGVPVSDAAGHGFGCRSIQAIAQQRGGLCQFLAERGTFLLRVMLPAKGVAK